MPKHPFLFPTPGPHVGQSTSLQAEPQRSPTEAFLSVSVVQLASGTEALALFTGCESSHPERPGLSGMGDTDVLGVNPNQCHLTNATGPWRC